jgi:O-antigen/teichoic acid export membrane protein
VDTAKTRGMDGDPGFTHDRITTQLRGSTLLLVGRLISIALNVVIQIVIVRYLSKSGYGAFAYVLTIVAVSQTFVTFGMDRAISRFVPIYDERREYNKVFGTIAMALTTVVGLGFSVVLLAYGLQGVLAGTVLSDSDAVTLLLILIFLSPIQAIDTLLMGLFAVYSKPRAIFLRVYVLAPGLRLAVVGLLILGGNDVFFLAAGYLVAGAVGVGIYAGVLARMLRTEGLLARLDPARLQIPVREVFRLTLPMLVLDFVYVVLYSSDVILLGHFREASEVAEFTVVQPAARLNELVFSSFLLLFTPAAARLFARVDREGLNELYWRTAVWIAVLSFPVFALTFALADPLTSLLFGARYEESGLFLSLLALGWYFQAAFGFSAATLMVSGKVLHMAVIYALAVVVNLALNLLLIPRYGALGAALGTSLTLIAHSLFKQVGLWIGTGVRPFDLRYIRAYVSIAVIGSALIGIRLVADADVAAGVALVVLASLSVLMLNRGVLRVGQTFPELRRFALARRLFGP